MRVLIVKGYLITAADTDEESIPQMGLLSSPTRVDLN